MRRLLPLLLVLSLGCAIRATKTPAEWESCLLYCRITNCTAKDVPTPLEPSVEPPVSPLLKAPNMTTKDGQMDISGAETHCTTLEVGAKSYSDTISAIGLALAGIYAKVHGLF